MNIFFKKQYYFLLIITLIFIGCGDNDTSDDKNQSKKNITNNFDDNSDNEKEDEDQSNSSENKGSHFQGESCKRCHSSTEKSDVENDEKFESGATIFTLLHGKDKDINSVAKNHTIRVLYADGTHDDFLTEEAGKGNAYLVNLQNKFFTSQVLNNGNVVNSSNKNSHDQSRMNCNSCHTSTTTQSPAGRIVNYKIKP